MHKQVRINQTSNRKQIGIITKRKHKNSINSFNQYSDIEQSFYYLQAIVHHSQNVFFMNSGQQQVT